MSTVLVPLHSPDLVERLKADLIAMYKPRNSQELFAIERIALAQQALRRCSILEASLFAQHFETAESDAAPTDDQPEIFTFGHPQQLKAWQTFLRYQAQTERNYRRALADLDRILALRDEMSQPEEIPAALLAAAAASSPESRPLADSPRHQPYPPHSITQPAGGRPEVRRLSA
jgi:hypothetical protein